MIFFFKSSRERHLHSGEDTLWDALVPHWSAWFPAQILCFMSNCLQVDLLGGSTGWLKCLGPLAPV